MNFPFWQTSPPAVIKHHPSMCHLLNIIMDNTQGMIKRVEGNRTVIQELQMTQSWV